MKKFISGLMFILVVGFSGLSSASTIDLFAYGSDVSKKIPPARDISINYDSSNWGSINSAYLSVKMIDEFDLIPKTEWADVASIEGVDPGVSSVEVGNWLIFSDWYWNIDVTNLIVLGAVSEALDFLLTSNSGDYKFLNAKLTVDYNEALNAVPVPAALFLFGPALLGFLGLRRKAQA